MIRNIPALLFLLTCVIGCDPDVCEKGNRALELGDYPLAITLYSRALEKNPAHPEARLGIGKAYLQKAASPEGDSLSWQRALMHLEAARTLASSDEVTRLVAQAWTERGNRLLFSGDTIRALSAISRAISIDDKSSEPLNIAGIIYYKMGRVTHAQRLFERALTIDSTSSTSAFNLGMLYWEERKIDKAHALWLKLLKKHPDDEELLYWFSMAEKQMRDRSAGDLQ